MGVVTRIKTREVAPPYEAGPVISLIVGPPGPYTEEELRLAWRAYKPRFAPRRDGTRPWAFWKFELGEDRPDDQPARLAELGLLRDDEVVKIADSPRGACP
jgi:hypothetical protein